MQGSVPRKYMTIDQKLLVCSSKCYRNSLSCKHHRSTICTTRGTDCDKASMLGRWHIRRIKAYLTHAHVSAPRSKCASNRQATTLHSLAFDFDGGPSWQQFRYFAMPRKTHLLRTIVAKMMLLHRFTRRPPLQLIAVVAGLISLILLLSMTDIPSRLALISSSSLVYGATHLGSPSSSSDYESGGDLSVPVFEAGLPKSPGFNYTRGLAIARLKKEDVSWIDEEDVDVERYIYVVDDPTAPLKPPKNKGHEAMVYLTYIIDHYDVLPDITLFMHAHRYAMHNSPLLNTDAVEMIQRLSSERVMREGYVNLRCKLDPGCPTVLTDHGNFGEHKEWKEDLSRFLKYLQPGKPLPSEMSQPCCAQFALSRERIQATPLAKYLFYRDWLLQTELEDYASGRTWEYLWHFIFTGKSVYCPSEFICYCDTYGICFDSPDDLEQWFLLGTKIGDIEEQLQRLRSEPVMEDDNASNIMGEEHGLERNLHTLQDRHDTIKKSAFERGLDPRVRAEAGGRAWSHGDGY